MLPKVGSSLGRLYEQRTDTPLALPTIPLFKSLQELLTSYPTPLRAKLLPSLHALLQQRLPNDPEASILHATRHLSADLKGDELVDALKQANEQILQVVRAREDGLLGGMYADWVKEWTQKLEEDNLVRP
jgi:U3 small nucleolar RNA-associated protein 6